MTRRFRDPWRHFGHSQAHKAGSVTVATVATLKMRIGSRPGSLDPQPLDPPRSG